MTEPAWPRHLAPAVVAAACLTLSGLQGAAAADLTPVTLSYAEKTVDFMPLQIALDAGYFKKHGLDATVNYLPAQQGIPALISHQVQAVGIGGSDAVSAEVAGAKLKLVATLTPIYIFQLWTRPKFASASALKGRRVGVASTTGSLYAGTVLALKEIGLTTSDVAITPLGSVVNVNSALLAGSIDAAASHPPATYQFQRAGLVNFVDIAKKKIPSVSAGVWFDQSYIAKHRAVVQAVVDAVSDAIRREKTDRAYAEAEMSKFLGVKNKAAIDFTYNFYIRDVLSEEPTPEVAQLNSDRNSLSATNPKLKALDVASMIDASFVKKLAQ